MNYVDALYVLSSGASFEAHAIYPSENAISRIYDNFEIDFVYFGTYKNRDIYVEIQTEMVYH